MPIVGKTFTITTSQGTAMYGEGLEVPADLAKRFPQYMAGFSQARETPHNPNLPLKLSKTAAQKLSEAELMQWIGQYHPGKVPAGQPAKAELLELVLSLQE